MSTIVNIDAIPRGQSLYTLAVTDQPVGTIPTLIEYDEVDVIAPARASVAQIIAAADLDGYEGCRVIGLIDHSCAYTVAWTTDGDLR